MSGSERKVLNKYYPPDYDPSKLPKLRLQKNRQYVIRVMAPFNMRCNVCGEFIYKGKKFNARRETVQDETYLGLWLFRFYIRCTRCISEITFKTDLKNCDYTCEAGATRLFEAEKLARENAEEELKQKEQDALNPMKVLENRTKDSRKEMVIMESLEELKELNSRYASIDKLHDTMIERVRIEEEIRRRREIEEEEELVRSVLHKGDVGSTSASGDNYVKRLRDSDEEDNDEDSKDKVKKVKTDISSNESSSQAVSVIKKEGEKNSWDRSVGSLSSQAAVANRKVTKTSLAGLVKVKPAVTTSAKDESKPPAAASGLTLLGDYSNSDDSSDADS